MTFTEQYLARLRSAIDPLDPRQGGPGDRVVSRGPRRRPQIFVCGNGGSAATASHFVTDVIKGASYNREKRFRIIALTDSLPTITAYANDVCYDCVFVEQLKNFAQPGDLVMAISGSGNSPNVLRRHRVRQLHRLPHARRSRGRDGGKLGPAAQLNIHVPVPHMGRIEDAHMIVCHMIGYQFMESED